MNDLTFFKAFNEHLLKDDIPSDYFNLQLREGIFPQKYPFTLLITLMKTEQNPKFHPEGNVWQHTMQVVDMAAKYRHLSEDPQVFMWASLLHDIGKGTTTRIRGGKITAYDHDIEGEKLSKNFLSSLTDDKDLIYKTSKLVRWHMQPLFVNKNLPFSRLYEMLHQISPSEVGLFSICDRLGRNNWAQDQINSEIEFVKIFFSTCTKITDDIEEKSKILKIIYGLEKTSRLMPISGQ